MAHYRELPNGDWQAQIFRRGVRRSICLPSREDAVKWAEKTEREIISAVSGKTESIKLLPDELSRIFAKAKERAKESGLPINLHRDDVVMLWARSQGVCEVTGISFNRFKPTNSCTRPWFPSLDRIDSRKGYSLDNCRMVCVAVNIAMGEWGEWVLNAIANSICYGRPGILINEPMPDPRDIEFVKEQSVA